MKDSKVFTTISYIVFTLVSASMVLPVLMLISISITAQSEITNNGFSLIPRMLSFDGYKVIFQDFNILIWPIIWTIIKSITAPLIGIIVNAMGAYCISRGERFKLYRVLKRYLMASMFFGGGMIPTYILFTKYYGLGNSPLIFYLPGICFAVGNVMLFNAYFKAVPKELSEAAYIDGATTTQVFWKIVLPLSKTIFFIQYITAVIGAWSGWQTSLIYLQQNKTYWELFYVIQRMISDAEFTRETYQQAGLIYAAADVPIENMEYACAVISVIPCVALFPIMQKQFSKGIAVGSLKG